MNIRPKTIRRLLTLFAISCIMIGGLWYAYHRSVKRHEIEIKNLRHDAMAAYQAADYETAVRLLSIYRDKTANHVDAEAEFAYGKASVHVEQPSGRHITEAIRIFENYLQTTRPGDPEAQHQLLQLYVMQGLRPEAVRLADEMLARTPDDPATLELKARALFGEHRKEEALAVSRKLNEVDPFNLKAQLLTVYLMSEMHASTDEILAHAQALQKAHRADPRFDVLMAVAAQQAHQDSEAIRWLRTAAGQVPPDATFVGELVLELDHAELYADATAFLTRAAGLLPDVQVQRLYAQRLWQDHHADVLSDRLHDQDPAKPGTDGTLIGYRALALFGLNHATEAQSLVEALAHRADGPSNAWAIALKATQTPAGTHALALTEVTNRLLQAAARDPQNPVLRVMLADAYLRMGEADLAINQCAVAYELAPSWCMPFLLMAQAQNNTGRYGEAVDSGRRAVQRAETHETDTTLARAYFNWTVESGTAEDYQKLAEALKSIQERWHDPQTLPLYVTVLARSGRRDEAIAAIRAALAAQPPLPAAALASLADVADAEKLNLGLEVRSALQELHGSSSENAVAQAGLLLKAGKAADGYQLLQNAAKGHESELSWRMVLAAYADMAALPDAPRLWTALGAENPGDLQVQQAILRANCRFGDRALWARAIDRVRALTSESGELWRIERARWLLAGTPSEQEKAEAVNQLTGVTASAPTLREPHRLLALAMEAVNNPSGAIDQLASVADSGDPAIIRELVRLLLSANRANEAVKYLDKFQLAHNRSSADRTWLAGAYADLGENEKAIAVLKTGPAGDDVDRDRKLAELYRRLGQADDAAALFRKLLDKNIADSGFWLQAASFFAGRQDRATAEQFMARLAAQPLPAGEVELARGQFAEMFSTEADALAHYQAATSAAPASGRAWGALSSFHLRHGRFSAASSAARDGLKSVPNDANLNALDSAARALSDLKDVAALQTLMDALSRNPRDAGANEMLAAVTSARAANPSSAETAQTLREVADRYPQDLLLQLQAARSLAMAGRNDAAIDVARRAAETHGTSAEPHRLLAGIYMNLHDWSRAEQAVLLWRQRAPESARAADLVLAGIYLQQPNKDPAGAIRVLSSYITPTIAGSPPKYPLVLDTYTRALVLAGREDEAAGLLKPLLADSSRWRTKWLELAALQKDAGAATQWVQAVIPFMQPDVAEQLALASAWSAVGVEFELPEALEKAGALLQPLLTDTNNASAVWELAAQTAQARSDFAAAEKAYRRLLKIDPQSAVVMNNLAYLLWLRGRVEDLPEARKLAETAVAQQPEDAVFYDTLARVQAKSGDARQANQSFRTAMQKDPASVEAMIGLADLLSHDPATRPEAKELLARIENLIPTSPRLAPVLRRQIQAVREAVSISN